MNAFNNFWSAYVDYAWGLPLVILLIGGGLFFTLRTRFLPFRGVRHAWDILRGKYDYDTDPGEITHFQALTSALSATIGMGNIAGVAVAITMGGPGAIFWMWIAGLVGMSTKFVTCTLAILFRKKDSHGIDQGGPMYFLEVGLGKAFKPLAIFFAICGMIGCLALFQVNQLADLIYNDYHFSKLIIGLLSMIIVGAVILGGIVRVGKVTSKLVPAMVIIYVAASLYIIFSHFTAIPHIIGLIVSNAFGSPAVVGGGTGFAFKEVLVTGVKRAAFSNEAGIGTAPMAHGAAKTKEPIREGLIAMLGPFIDTNIVCTMTALILIITGVEPVGSVVMTANAFTSVMGDFGRYVLTLVIILFSISTMISYSYYSLKCAKYLFGDRFGGYYVYIYLISLPVAAVFSTDTVINILDSFFAMMVVPTLTGALLLSGAVVSRLRDYYARHNL